MKRIFKLLGLMIALCLLFSLTGAAAESNEKSGLSDEVLTDHDFGLDSNDFEWTFSQQEPKGVVVLRYLGNENEIGIPGVLSYIAVVGIGDEAFKDCKTLESVTIPDFVTTMGKAAFEGCENLTSVLLIGTDTNRGGQGVPQGADKYYGYGIVGETVISGSCPMKTIGDNAFRGCITLKDMNIADSTSQSPHTRWWQIGLSDLTGVNIPNGVTTIGAHAFDGCVGIESMTIPDCVTQIGEGAFDNCPALTLKASEGSFALQYAQDNGIPFEVISM